jgi:hypothetical protein
MPTRAIPVLTIALGALSAVTWVLLNIQTDTF